MGIYFIVLSDIFTNLVSSIIIANRNKIAIAPTYTVIKSKAKNSHSKIKSMKAERIKEEIKNRSEKTGCCE